MRFLCLCYHEEEKLASLTQGEMDSLVGACMGWAEDLEKGGHHILTAGLQSVRSAATVRVRNGKLSTTDGPFAETKELVAGFWLWQVESKEEAIEWLKRAPFDGGTEVEIRQVGEWSDFPADVQKAADNPTVRKHLEQSRGRGS